MANVHGGLGLKAVTEQLARHGFDRVKAAWERVSRQITAAGTSQPTLRQLVLGADDVLNPIVRPDLKEDREDEQREAYSRRVQRTRQLYGQEGNA
jgi:hypothetical protein